MNRSIVAMMLAAVGAGALLVGASRPASSENGKSAGAAAAQPVSWTDLGGKTFTASPGPGERATVFLFVSTQCPISNLYTARISELAQSCAGRGVRFFLVDPNTEDTPAVLRRYVKERDLRIPIVPDPELRLANWLTATKTPEAVMLDATGDVCYRGRIDDSQDRSQVRRHDLREAIESVLAGKPIARPRTISFGCAIFRQPAVSAPTTVSGRVTYTRDIAPILNKNCIVCHRAGESAPFALQTYAEAKTWAASLKEYTARRIMPPWKAVDGGNTFHDARWLTDGQIATIARWADSGAPQGSSKDLPAPPAFPNPNDWSLGKPDMVVEPDRPYHLDAEGPDVYRNFVLPVQFQEDRYVSAMEFKPGNRAIVHHIVLYIDEQATSLKFKANDKEPGYTVPGTGIGVLDAQWGEVWVPGRTPRLLPEGVAVRISKGARLVMQVHYHKNGAPQQDTSKLALYFARTRVAKLMRTVPLVYAALAIKPGEANQRVRMVVPISQDYHLHTIFPHMHLLGREMRVNALLQDGDRKPLSLIRVDDWDFNWQETYAYKQPVALPKGTRIELEAVYDNTDSNPRQMNHPPKLVRWGEQTTDEMCVCVMRFTVDAEKLAIDPGAPSTQ